METVIRHGIATTAIGDLTLVAAGEALTGVYFPHHWTRPSRNAFGSLVKIGDDALLASAARQIDEYLRGERTAFDIPTATRGDAFQERIWSLIRKIPYGTTRTYGALAADYGDKSLAREVGQAVGSNPLSLVVPCHRVVGSNGKLGGYAGGFERKRQLLDLEGPRERVRALTLDGFAVTSGA
jgi:methylated-DNA-[protein]-cysteine S-methyltransferase